MSTTYPDGVVAIVTDTYVQVVRDDGRVFHGKCLPDGPRAIRLVRQNGRGVTIPTKRVLILQPWAIGFPHPDRFRGGPRFGAIEARDIL